MQLAQGQSETTKDFQRGFFHALNEAPAPPNMHAATKKGMATSLICPIEISPVGSSKKILVAAKE
jgi:hypothetical protein